MTALLAGAEIEGDSCMMTVLGRGAREGHSYTMTALLAGIEGGSCTTAMLAGREV